MKSFLRGRLLLLQSFQVLFHFEMQIQKLHRVSGCNHSSQTLSRQPRVLMCGVWFCLTWRLPAVASASQSPLGCPSHPHPRPDRFLALSL